MLGSTTALTKHTTKLPMSFLNSPILVFLVVYLCLFEARRLIMHGDGTSVQEVDKQQYYDPAGFSKLKLEARVFLWLQMGA